MRILAAFGWTGETAYADWDTMLRICPRRKAGFHVEAQPAQDTAFAIEKLIRDKSIKPHAEIFTDK